MPAIIWTFASFLIITMKSLAEKEFELCVTHSYGKKDLSNHNLTEVPAGLSLNTQYLDLSHNKISRLESDALVGFPQLCFLKLNNNTIQYISPMAFLHSSGIKVLNISNNLLTTIPDLSLPRLRILDLSGNLYSSYKLGSCFAKLTNLTFLMLGGPNIKEIKLGDFACLSNTSLKHLSLHSDLQQYGSGALAQIQSLQEITLIMSFCQHFDMFKAIVMDLNQTETTAIRLNPFFPRYCQISSDPFEGFKGAQFLRSIIFVESWFNSSVMVKLLKNVFQSTLEELSFIDIVYYEDTPDGVQFYPTHNQTVHLRSLTFNGVRHLQYSYPKINISVTYLSQLAYLKFSGTGMNISPCNLISDIPSLMMLDLSNNLLSDDGFWWPACSYTKVFPALRQLWLSHNRFVYLSFISRKTHQMMALESLDLSFNSIQLDGECSWPTHLMELSLSNNNLGNGVFNYLSPHFRRINLSKTGITAITQKDLSSFPNLTHLILSSNSIQVLPMNLHIPTLFILHVDQNAITSISQEPILGLPRLQHLKAGKNPFSCSCESYWFVTSFSKSLLPDWPVGYTCSTPPSFAGLSLEEYKPTKPSCLPWLQASIAVPVVLILVAAFGITFYACDGIWYFKMLWVWIRVKRRSYKGAGRLQSTSFRYHAFISYSQHDSTWVDSQLVPRLENVGLSLCVHERDFVPGRWIIDNIISSVEDSYKTLFVLSQNFVQSEWCTYELFFAQHRAISIQDDSLVFILLEPIPANSLPKKFLKLRALLRKQTYLEWPKDERKQQVFWASLRAMLHGADKHMAIKKVATDIVDTLPLIADQ